MIDIHTLAVNYFVVVATPIRSDARLAETLVRQMSPRLKVYSDGRIIYDTPMIEPGKFTHRDDSTLPKFLNYTRSLVPRYTRGELTPFEPVPVYSCEVADRFDRTLEVLIQELKKHSLFSV